MDRTEIRKGLHLTSDGGAITALSRPDPAADLVSKFDAHVAAANKILDQIAAAKARKADHEDFRDIIWRVGCR